MPPLLSAGFPSPLRAAAPGGGGNGLLRYYPAFRRLAAHRFPFRFAAYRSAFPPVMGGTPRGLLPESHVYLARRAVRTHPGATGWNPNAFAPIVRVRPFPVFGRLSSSWARALRLRPGGSPHALPIPPRGGHPALRLALPLISGVQGTRTPKWMRPAEHTNETGPAETPGLSQHTNCP